MHILFIDMKRLATPLRPPTALRVLDTLLLIAIPVLAVITLAVVIFTIAVPTLGSGELYAHGVTSQAVVEHTTPSGTALVQDVSIPFVAPSSPEPYVRFLSVPVQVQVSGFGPRLVVISVALANVALAWVAVLALKGITTSSLAGEVFTAGNSDRLARLGKVAIAYPVITFWVGRSVFNSVTTDAELGVSGFWSRAGVDNWEAWMCFGLLLFVVAKAFRWGLELQLRDAATI